MDIGAVLSRAWQIIWRFKVLWLFGILASCSSSSGGSNGASYTTEGELPLQWQTFIERIPDWQVVLFIVGMVLVILLLVALAVFLGTIGRIGLIRGTLQAEQGAARLEFGELFRGSTPYFWRVFLLNLIVGLVAAVAIIALVLFAVLGSVVTLGIGLICLIPLLCLLVPIGWFISIILEQATIAIVVENLDIMDGLRRGWDVVKDNLGITLVMGLILFVGVSFLGGLIIGLPAFAIILPAALGAATNVESFLRGGVAVAAICLVLYLPVAILLNGILQSYIHTGWTLTFLRLTSYPQIAPVEPEPL